MGKDNVYIFCLKVKEKADSSVRFSVIFLFDVDLFFIQSFIHIFLQQSIQHGNNGDKYQHTHHAKETAAQRNRCQHPDGRKADGTAHHLGIEQVAFDLLNVEEHDDEELRLFRVYRQNQEGTDAAADECPEDGDQGGEGDQHAYQ